MRFRTADAKDGMSLDIPEDCEVVVLVRVVEGVRLRFFFFFEQKFFSEKDYSQQGRTIPGVVWTVLTEKCLNGKN